MSLIDTDKVHARKTDPNTAKSAAIRARGKVNEKAEKILALTAQYGPVGLTMSEMSVLMSLEKPMFSSLYSKLEREGLIIRRPANEKRMGRGRPETVYVTPEFAGIPKPAAYETGIKLPPYAQLDKQELTAQLLQYIDSRKALGATIEECSDALNVDRSRISSWFAPLTRNNTLIAPPGFTRRSKTNNSQQVYVLPRYKELCRR